MPIRKHDETWPSFEQFTPTDAARQQEQLGRLPVLQKMGLRLEKADKDYTKLSISPSTEVARPKGVWQGGILATLVDTAAGQALRTTLKLDHDAVTVHLD